MKIKSNFLRFIFLLKHLLFSKAKGKNVEGASLSWSDFITPYLLSLNIENKTIQISKRNWYLIGVDIKVFKFGQVRNIYIDQHLLTADIKIKVYAGTIECFWFRKKSLNQFRNQLLDISDDSFEFGVIDE